MPSAEVIGHNPRILKSGKQSPEFYADLWGTISAGRTWTGRLQNRRKDGSLYWESTIITPLGGEDGQILYYVSMKEDVTPVEELHSTLRQARKEADLLAANSGTVYWSVNAAGLYTEVGTSCLQVWGYRPEELLGQRHFFDLHPSDGQEEFKRAAFAVFARKEPFTNLLNQICTGDGRVIWVVTNGVPLLDDDGHLLGYIGTDTDVTALKQMEIKLHHALDQAQAANRAKSEFLAMMSHELRTPLNGVLGCAELLATSALDAEQQDYAQTISDSGHHLLGIIQDILDYANLDTGRVLLESAPVIISDLVHSSSQAARQVATAKGLEFLIESAPNLPAGFTGDHHRISQVLIKLLGNAVKFTTMGAVVLRITPYLEDGRAGIDFAVADTGPGITTGSFASLFQPFTQADSSWDRSFEGIGLGLAIVQRMAQSMGGTITVVSTTGKGSTFTFRLPL